MEFIFNEEVRSARHSGTPIVALESTVIAHGLPHPHNLETAFELERIVRENGAVPATIAMFDGRFHVGLSKDQIEKLGRGENIRKISRRDLALAVAGKWECATTVATTMIIAHRAGIKVFATGGIGGVHRGEIPDISADLPELAQTPMTVVCAGPKIVLDLPATREWLETHGVTILGFGCNEMPAFYSKESGQSVDQNVPHARAVADVIAARDSLGLPGSILVTVPIPEHAEIPRSRMETMLSDALKAADAEGVRGKDVTPYLLRALSERSAGETLKANIDLLKNNALVAAKIAAESSKQN